MHMHIHEAQKKPDVGYSQKLIIKSMNMGARVVTARLKYKEKVEMLFPVTACIFNSLLFRLVV